MPFSLLLDYFFSPFILSSSIFLPPFYTVALCAPPLSMQRLGESDPYMWQLLDEPPTDVCFLNVPILLHPTPAGMQMLTRSAMPTTSLLPIPNSYQYDWGSSQLPTSPSSSVRPENTADILLSYFFKRLEDSNPVVRRVVINSFGQMCSSGWFDGWMGVASNECHIHHQKCFTVGEYMVGHLPRPS